MSARLAWEGGGEAQLVSFAGEAIVLRSSVPSPPGSRIEGTFSTGSGAPRAQGSSGEAPLRLRLKVHACRREPDGSFTLRGRPVDLTREGRARLEALAAAPGDGGG